MDLLFISHGYPKIVFFTWRYLFQTNIWGIHGIHVKLQECTLSILTAVHLGDVFWDRPELWYPKTEFWKWVTYVCTIYTCCSNADVIFDKNYLDVNALPHWCTVVDANTHCQFSFRCWCVDIKVIIRLLLNPTCLVKMVSSSCLACHGQVHLQRLEQSDAELSTTRWCIWNERGRGVVRSYKAVILWVVPLPSTSGTRRSNEGL